MAKVWFLLILSDADIFLLLKFAATVQECKYLGNRLLFMVITRSGRNGMVSFTC